MNITAITRFKHGSLYALLKRLNLSQADLARNSGLSEKTIFKIINLAKRPTQDQANKIQKAIGEKGEYFDVLSEWPETFVGINRGFRIKKTEDIYMEQLLENPEVMMLQAPDQKDTGLQECLVDMMRELSEREREVLELRFLDGKTLNEIGMKLKICPSRVNQIESKGLRKMRHPSRLRVLEDSISLRDI